jgi:hypothetical protein
MLRGWKMEVSRMGSETVLLLGVRTSGGGQDPTAKGRGLTSVVKPPPEMSGAIAQTQVHHLCRKILV